MLRMSHNDTVVFWMARSSLFLPCRLLLCIIFLYSLLQGVEGNNETIIEANCEDFEGSCDSPHAGIGCDDCEIAACVCGYYEFCCTKEWKPSCVAVYHDLCAANITQSTPTISSTKEGSFLYVHLILASTSIIAFLVASSVMIVLLVYRGIHNRTRRSTDNFSLANHSSSDSFDGSVDSSYGLIKYSAPAMGSTMEAFREDLKKKWAKPLSDLPVHIDLPRLVHGVNLYQNGVLVWPPDTIDDSELEEEKRERLVIYFLAMLATILETPELADTILERSEEFFDSPNIDVSRRLQKFLLEIINDYPRICGVLKTVNQSIVSGAVLQLKYRIGNKFPYQDVNRAWTVDIHINSCHVTITHNKWERSTTENSFRFRWRLNLEFDANLEVMEDVNLSIVNISYGIADDPVRKNAVRREMDYIISNEAVISSPEDDTPSP
eukprot:TRINITY_DN850_c0_g1_i1.p1 TRINITY_DN850_c0_g1~~TRINITY_DN850_c0_g1_i1.p1  ORF type:complete len:436 (+),score=55.98 TRINITY_DN850_c0_g1_i1:100-1407(+)